MSTSTSPSTSPIRIDVWSDVACPWCWVGKRHLEQAARDSGIEIDVHWHAFELNPGAPKTVEPDLDYVARLASKYGASRDQAQGMIDRMTDVGDGVGLDFRFDRVQPTNTFDAHRLLAWAESTGKQDALKERLFELYMHEGKSIADREVLVGAAQDVGLDPDKANAILSGNEFASQVRAEQGEAARLGVSGVPFFVVDESLAFGGAQPPKVIAEVLERATKARRPQVVVEGGEACGIDGC